MDVRVLPTKPKALASAIDQHVKRVKDETGFWRLSRTLYNGYLNGASQTSVFDPTNGRIGFSYPGEKDTPTFKNQDMLDMVDKHVSRTLTMDWAPSVIRNDMALGAIRERAIAQAIADSIVRSSTIERLKIQLSPLLHIYGCAGAYTTVTQDLHLGVVADIQPVPPWEIFPFPFAGMDPTKTSGIIWERYVQYEWLQDHVIAMGGSKTSLGRNKSKLRTVQVSIGNTPQDANITDTSLSLGRTEVLGPGGETDNDSDHTDLMVEIRETWIESYPGICSRYIMTSGEAVLVDRDFTSEPAIYFTPLCTGRAIETGTFYGLGLCDKLFPLNRESEKLVSQMLKNIEAFDKYGITVIGRGQIDLKNSLIRSEEGFKVLTVEPDMGQEALKVQHIAPLNSGDVPGKTAAMLMQAQQRLGMPDTMMGDAPGRTDSFGAIQFLDEQANRIAGTAPNAIKNIMAGVYRAAVAQALRYFSDGQTPVPLTRLDESMAGLVFDPRRGAAFVGNQNNPVPDLTRLTFTTRSAAPRSSVARKQEALNLLQLGLQSPTQVKLLGLKEGLDFAGYNELETNAYRMVVRNLLLCYNDGVTPGEIVFNPQTALPDLQLTVLNAFVVGPEFAAASAQVQNAIFDYKSLLEQQMGGLPDGFPAPDDIAAMRATTETAAQTPNGAPPNA